MTQRLSFRERQVHVSRLHDLIEHVATGAITEGQHIVVATVALANMFGYEPQELIRGMSINELVRHSNHQGLVSEAIRENDERVRRAMRGVEGLRKDGSIIRVSVELEFNVPIDGMNCTAFTVVRRSND